MTLPLSLFDFELPTERIAQTPAAARADARMLVMHGDAPLEHHRVHELPAYLGEGDVVVVNDTQVLPARLHGHKTSGGAVELLLVEPLTDRRWRALGRSSKPLREGMRVLLPEGASALVVARGEGTVEVELDRDPYALMQACGEMPLPPYIDASAHGQGFHRERYQTVFAARPGAIAAPTAGLHFTPELVAAAEARGAEVVRVTLHVGIGTFTPIREEAEADLRLHRMHAERWEITPAAAARIGAARRVLAVGTTVVRTLESAATGERHAVRSGSDSTTIFITPGHRFQVVDALLTNFHLPRSTLLVLVSAFAGRERVLAAYRTAVAEGYRFYSYGDAMLIV